MAWLAWLAWLLDLAGLADTLACWHPWLPWLPQLGIIQQVQATKKRYLLSRRLTKPLSHLLRRWCATLMALLWWETRDPDT